MTESDKNIGYQSPDKKTIGNHSIGNIGNQEIWLTTKQFCELAEFKNAKSGSRPLKNALQGKTWCGCKLEVRETIGKKGGKSGKNYEVNLATLPPELIAKYFTQNGDPKPDLSVVKNGTSDLNTTSSLETQASQVVSEKPDLSPKNIAKQELEQPSKILVKQDNEIGNHLDSDIGNQSPENTLPSLENRTSQGTSQVLEADKWLTAAKIAELSGNNQKYISGVLSDAFKKGTTWLGCELKVFESAEGKGHGGKSYLAHIDTLPAPIKSQWYAKKQPNQMVILQPKTELILSKQNEGEMIRRLNIVKQVIKYPKHSTERAAIIRELVGTKSLKANGKLTELTSSRIYQWVDAYEKSGGTGLYNKTRKDIGKKRTLITRKWDNAMRDLIPPEQQHQITLALDYHIRSLWRSGAGYTKITQLATMWLQRTTNHVLGIANIDPEICDVPRNRTNEVENKQYLALYCKETDAKKFHDKYVPTIRRTTDGMLPNQIHVGDVHPMDVAVRRQEGSKDVVYPRLISWFDVVTHEIWIDIKMCEKGSDVTQADVSQSFCNKSEKMGICGTLYLDNGMEYQHGEMLKSIAQLNNLLQREEQLRVFEGAPEIIRAQPYEAQVKPIEGIFAVLEQNYFCHLPGYVGGNRMTKKTHNMGKEPRPFKGTIEELHEQVEILLTEYHNRPQKSLGNKSPNQVKADHINNGWKMLWVDRQSLLMSFGERDSRKVSNGCITWDGEKYYHDELLKYTTFKLEVTYFKHDPRYAFVYLPDNTIICAKVEVQYQYIDADATGAKEKKRRKKQLLYFMSELKNHCSRLDVIKLTKDWNEQQPALPEGEKQQIQRSPEAEAMLAAMQKAQALPMPEPKSKLIGQWGPDDTASEVIWDEEDEEGQP